MTRDELASHLDTLFASDAWHWFTWHFRTGGRAGIHPFAADVIDALMAIDAKSPGFAKRMAGDLSSLRGMKKHEPHYEQLLQRLAELHIILQLVTHKWSFSASFDLEPTVGDGQLRNPEIRITGGPHPLLVEVKAPSLLQHIRSRGANPAQISTRAIPKEQTAKLAEELGAVTLPRDNVVKDFLVSAESKFRPFRLADPQVRTMLVIVWDDFIYEPLSALLGKGSGLLTAQSFFRTTEGEPQVFPSVDGMLVIRHLHQLLHATRDEPFSDGCTGSFDYGAQGTFPFKAFVQNPAAMPVPEELVSALHGLPPGPELGAEYIPSDLILWVEPRPPEA